MIVGNVRRRKGSRSQSALAVSTARGGRPDRARIVVAVVVVLVVAGAVVAGVLFQRHKTTAMAQAVIPAKTVAGSVRYPASIDRANATVLVGKVDAKIIIDTYEDFLCPYCGDYESTNFSNIEKQLEAGTVQVRYHIINLLDQGSNPAGYSLMAANIALAVATVAPDKFINFHYSLYNMQPRENGPGWTQAQLTSLANRLGVSGSEFEKLVNNKTYDRQITSNLTAAEQDQSLWQPDGRGGRTFGTPTIVANGQLQDWQHNAHWLDTLTKAAHPN